MSEIILEFPETPQLNFLIDMQGKSLYNMWLELGNTGDYAVFLDWLRIQGESAYELAVQAGFTGTESEWILSLEGTSAYEIAIQEGFVGTQAEWILSLKVGIQDSITSGVTDKAPSQDAVLRSLALKANLDSPTFTGNVSGITRAMIGLSDADNTSDVNKPISTAVQTALSGKQATSTKNQANGYAGLGSDGKLISSQLPSITISDTSVVSTQSAMLAITAETGDVAVRTDLNKSFILKGTDPTILSHWQELLTPTSDVTSVFGRTGPVTAGAGDYNADQITETTTRKFQTANQKAYNDATSSIQTQINGKQATLGYTPENVANKSDSYTASSSTTYASTKAIVDGLATKQNTITNPITGTGTTGQVSFWNSASTQTGDNGLFWDNINKRLGIGVSTPAYKVDILKTGVGIQDVLSLDNLNNSVGVVQGIKVKFSGFNLEASSTYGTANHLLTIGFSTLKNISITQEGNVGIGTTSPSSKLTVNSDLPIRLEANSNSSGYYTLLGNNYDYDKSFLINNKGDEIFTYTQQETLGLSLSNPRAGNIRLSTNGSERMRITSGGNVGIGTEAPSTKLEVVGDLKLTGSRPINFSSANGSMIIRSSSGGWVTGTFFESSSGTSLAHCAAFGNSDTLNYFYIGNDYVNPWFKIEPSGAATFASSVTASNGTLIGGTLTSGYIPKATGANSIGNSQIFDNGTNVGIGTTSPITTLTVKQKVDSFAGGLRIEKSDNDTSLFLYNYGTKNIISSSYGSTGSYMPLSLQTSDLDRVYILANGNVGIGTTSPNRKLEVADIDSQLSLKGTITGAPVYQTWYNSSNVRRGYFGFPSNSNGTLRLVNEESGDIYITPINGSTIVSSTVTASNGTLIGGTLSSGYIPKATGANSLGNSLIYDNGTNVGIGTTSPTSKLQVVGIPEYASNALAITGGLTVGAFYHTAGVLKVVI